MAASGLQEDWAAISQHQKQKFRQEHSDALGANLTKVLTEVVEEEFLKQSWSKFAAKGDLLDEADMQAKIQGLILYLQSLYVSFNWFRNCVLFS